MKAGLLALILVLVPCCRPTAATSPPTAIGSTITLPAISVADSDSFGIDISGQGSVVTKVDIHSRYGTVSLGGTTVSALVYKQIPWTGYSLILYQALALDANGWSVFWFYCSGSSLTYVYWETTSSATVSKAPMTGACTTTATTRAVVSWPSMSMSAPASVLGFSAHGSQLDIENGARDHTTFDGQNWAVYPYAVVDCTKICGSPGWYELHSLLWDRDKGEAAFGIFYFISGQSDRVRLDYGLELPALRRPTDASFTADWTHTS